MVRVRIRIKVRVSVMVRFSIRPSWVVNFALFRCYRPVIYTRPPTTPTIISRSSASGRQVKQIKENSIT